MNNKTIMAQMAGNMERLQVNRTCIADQVNIALDNVILLGEALHEPDPAHDINEMVECINDALRQIQCLNG